MLQHTTKLNWLGSRYVSIIDGIQETQEMPNFWDEKNITSDVEVIAIQNVNDAYIRMQQSDVKYRFVIDTKTLPDS